MKGQQQIEHTLQALRAANETSSVGPGSQATDEVLLGRFYSRPYCRKLRSRLSAQGISTTMQRLGNQSAIYIARKDRIKAFDELAEHNLTHSDMRPSGLGRIYDLPVFLVVCGFLLLLFSAMIAQPLIGVANFATCCVLSWLWARFRRNWLLNDGKGTQYSVSEMLITIGLVAFLFGLWRFVIQHL